MKSQQLQKKQQKSGTGHIWLLLFIILGIIIVIIIIVLVCVLPNKKEKNSTKSPELFNYGQGSNSQDNNAVQSGDTIHLSYMRGNNREWATACSWPKNNHPGQNSAFLIFSNTRGGPIMYNDNQVRLAFKNGDNWQEINGFTNPANTSPGKKSVFQILKTGGGVINSNDQINLRCANTGEFIVAASLNPIADDDSEYNFSITKN